MHFDRTILSSCGIKTRYVGLSDQHQGRKQGWVVFNILTLSTLSNFSRLLHSLFWKELKRSIGVKGLQMYDFCVHVHDSNES